MALACRGVPSHRAVDLPGSEWPTGYERADMAVSLTRGDEERLGCKTSWSASTGARITSEMAGDGQLISGVRSSALKGGLMDSGSAQ